ncbi:MAG: TRAP transporter small permease [Desulfovibrionaceae bacterium]|nr:TRAP transporter small permease [Desulfovibrionaceae bacterium]
MLIFLKQFYDNFEEAFCAVCMAAMVTCLTLQVGIRIVSGSALAWTEELSRYAFLWTVYIAAAFIAKRNAHVRITAQFLPMPLWTRFIFRLIADVIWVFFLLYIAWQSWLSIETSLEFPEVSPTLHVTKAYVEMIIPAGFILMSWRIVEDYLKRLRGGTLYELVREVGV